MKREKGKDGGESEDTNLPSGREVREMTTILL